MNDKGPLGLAFAEASFYRLLSIRSKVKFLSAVFFTVAPVALLSLSTFHPPRPWQEVLALTLGSGVLALLGGLSFIQNFRFLFLAILAQIALFLFIIIFATQPRPSVEGLGCVVLMGLGYVFFISFINGEGATSFRLQAEMAMARQIHSSLVPPINRASPRLEVFGTSVPSSAMGGDLLDIVEEEGKVGLFVADVSGHGVHAGIVMAMIKSAIRTELLASRGLEAMLSDLNRLVLELREPSLFVTLACLRIDESRSAEYSLAGHPPILHYDHNGREVRRLSNRHLPLGVLPEATYRVETVGLSPGDLLVFLTDGLTEVMDDEGRQFGGERIEALVAENVAKPLPELYATIMEAVGRFGRQADDQSLLLVRLPLFGSAPLPRNP